MLAPSGNATTVPTRTPVPRTALTAVAIQTGLTQTATKPYLTASRHRISMSCRFASGRNSVCSISFASCVGVIISGFLMADPPHVLLSAPEIQKRVAELAAEVRRDFPSTIHLVAVLKGAFVFLGDLIRHMPGEVTIDFIAVESYG